jgi:hypothetical protein
MNWSRFSLGKLLQNGLDMLQFLWFDFFISKTFIAGRLWLLVTVLHLLKLIYLNVIKVDELSFIVLDKELQCSRTVASSLGTWVRCYPDNTNSTETSKAFILELFRDRPRNQVSRRTKTPFEMFSDGFLIY